MGIMGIRGIRGISSSHSHSHSHSLTITNNGGGLRPPPQRWAAASRPPTFVESIVGDGEAVAVAVAVAAAYTPYTPYTHYTHYTPYRSKNRSEKKVIRIAWPGGQNVRTLRRSRFHPLRRPQRPYGEKKSGKPLTLYN